MRVKPVFVLCLLSFVLPPASLAAVSFDPSSVTVEEGKSATVAVSGKSPSGGWTDTFSILSKPGAATATATISGKSITVKGVAAGTTKLTVSHKYSTSRTKTSTESATLQITVTSSRVSITVPTAATGFVFDNTLKTGVAAGDHYTRAGTYEATAAGDYTATVTPASGYCWPDKTYGAKTIDWSIARRKATVTVVSTNKVVGATFDGGYADPIFMTTVDNLIDGDASTLTWDVFRTNACEGAGTYDLLVEGAARQGSYDLAFVGGSYSIMEEPLEPGFLLMLK